MYSHCSVALLQNALVIMLQLQPVRPTPSVLQAWARQLVNIRAQYTCNIAYKQAVYTQTMPMDVLLLTTTDFDSRVTHIAAIQLL